MKIFLRNINSFSQEAIDIYRSFATFPDEKEADLIVINDFDPIESTKPVACNSTGIDHITSPAIISLIGEDLNSFTAVPELCLGMAIYLTRMRKQEEIRGKTLGVIGYGRIGQRFTEYAEALGMKVVFYDKKHTLAEDHHLYTLLAISDIVSIHITSDEENRGYFDLEKFGTMKEGAIFLNSSRPWLVDYDALKWALDNKLSCAWFDFEMPFMHERLITTPHLGGTTVESRKKSEILLAEKLKKIYGW